MLNHELPYIWLIGGKMKSGNVCVVIFVRRHNVVAGWRLWRRQCIVVLVEVAVSRRVTCRDFGGRISQWRRRVRRISQWCRCVTRISGWRHCGRRISRWRCVRRISRWRRCVRSVPWWRRYIRRVCWWRCSVRRVDQWRSPRWCGYARWVPRCSRRCRLLQVGSSRYTGRWLGRLSGGSRPLYCMDGSQTEPNSSVWKTGLCLRCSTWHSCVTSVWTAVVCGSLPWRSRLPRRGVQPSSWPCRSRSARPSWNSRWCSGCSGCCFSTPAPRCCSRGSYPSRTGRCRSALTSGLGSSVSHGDEGDVGVWRLVVADFRFHERLGFLWQFGQGLEIWKYMYNI